MRYENELFVVAKQVDKVMGNNLLSESVVRLVRSTEDSEEIRNICKILSDYTIHNELIEADRKIFKDFNEKLLKLEGYRYVKGICNTGGSSEDNRNLDELLRDLNELIGLDNVKSKVNDLVVYQQVQKKRESFGLTAEKTTLHLAFLGNPGTGKTTVARIVGRIYKQLGLLSKGHFVEVSRTDLIAGYQGQTALKVKKVIDRARGGVLFIDEAYSITENEHSDSYGRECLTELTKALEDYRDDLVVIVAGYTELMKQFFESNPGLKSRFNTFINFDDYNAEELKSILISFVEKNQYTIDEKTLQKIQVLLSDVLEHKEKDFPNGRYVRNLYDDLVLRQAKRVIKLSNPSREDLMTITEEDVVL